MTTGVMVVEGRELSAGDIGQMQGLLAEHPDWGRTRLSEELCRRWDWRNRVPSGRGPAQGYGGAHAVA